MLSVALHKLRDWADMLLVAPLSANTLAKLANGLCDNLVVRERIAQVSGALCGWPYTFVSGGVCSVQVDIKQASIPARL